MLKHTFFFCFLSLLSITTNAQGQKDTTSHFSFIDGICNTGNWGRPFWADMHSTITRGEIAIGLNSPEYDWAQTGEVHRPYVFANLGVDLPIWSSNLSNNKFGLSVTLPFSIDVWLDMFEQITAPVINTGYRYGLPEFRFIQRFEKKILGIKNYAINLAPLEHECTHIGDELTIMRKNLGMPLTRINVSHNYSELILTLNDPDGSLKKNHAFRFGFMLLHDFDKGWYSILQEEGDVNIVAPSKSPYEFYLQYQYQSNTSKNNWQLIASFEARNRVKYNYPAYFTSFNEEWLSTIPYESREWGLNAFLGVRYNNPKIMKHHTIGVGLRAFTGINPYGQFRALPTYNQYGIALIFE